MLAVVVDNVVVVVVVAVVVLVCSWLASLLTASLVSS